MTLDILKYDLIDAFRSSVNVSPMETLAKHEKLDIPVDYFKFYNSVYSVYY